MILSCSSIGKHFSCECGTSGKLCSGVSLHDLLATLPNSPVSPSIVGAPLVGFVIHLPLCLFDEPFLPWFKSSLGSRAIVR